MRIAIGSYYRTGSTWLFNAVRTIFQHDGCSITVHGDCDVVPYSTDVCIHKVHDFSNELYAAADCTLTITRDYADADASFERAFNHRINADERKKSIDAAEKWKEVADLVFEMDMIKSNAAQIISDIMHLMDMERTDERIDDITQRVMAIKPNPKLIQDPETLYFSNHITSS
jgi:hypothetical protein